MINCKRNCGTTVRKDPGRSTTPTRLIRTDGCKSLYRIQWKTQIYWVEGIL